MKNIIFTFGWKIRTHTCMCVCVGLKKKKKEKRTSTHGIKNKKIWRKKRKESCSEKGKKTHKNTVRYLTSMTLS